MGFRRVSCEEGVEQAHAELAVVVIELGAGPSSCVIRTALRQQLGSDAEFREDPASIGPWAPTGAVETSFLLGSRRGPVSDRETTRSDGVAWERKRGAQGQIRPTPQVREPAFRTLPRWGSRVRVPSSAPESALYLQKRERRLSGPSPPFWSGPS
jgi:hypothetical protein